MIFSLCFQVFEPILFETYKSGVMIFDLSNLPSTKYKCWHFGLDASLSLIYYDGNSAFKSFKIIKLK